MTKITEEIKNAILGIVGEDRADVLDKAAQMLEGSVGDHQVYVGSSKNIEWNGMVIDISTKKKNGKQIVKNFFAWEKGDRSTMKMFM